MELAGSQRLHVCRWCDKHLPQGSSQEAAGIRRAHYLAESAINGRVSSGSVVASAKHYDLPGLTKKEGAHIHEGSNDHRRDSDGSREEDPFS